jgi:hypothetical protein
MRRQAKDEYTQASDSGLVSQAANWANVGAGVIARAAQFETHK